jgi:hypothetical protein
MESRERAERSSSEVLPTPVSETTAKRRKGEEASAAQALRDWSRRAMEGARKRTLPPGPATFSAILRATRVLPVPGGMMSLPRGRPFS